MSSSADRAFITRLPAELLAAILNEFDVFLTGEGKPDLSIDHPPRALHPDLVALRSVCRLFRIMVYEMPFWYVEDVHITALLPSVPNWIESHYNYSRWEKEVVGFQIHLQDQLFVCCLGKRSKWRFKHSAFLLTILEYVPLSHLNTTSIVIDFPDYQRSTTPSLPYPDNLVSASIAMLAICRNLTCLEINTPHDEVSLNLLAISCPALKRLRITGIWAEYQGGGLRGNLDGLANLEEVDIQDFDHHQFRHASVLPLSSAATLTRLSLLCFWEFHPEDMCLKVLDSFVNLRFLSLSPLSPNMATLLRRANLNLSDFRIIMWDDGYGIDSAPEEYFEIVISGFDKLMASKSLRNLKEFRFGIDGHSQYVDLCRLRFHTVVKAIVKYQPLLEKLVLAAYPDESSFALLPELVNLKALTWYCHETNEIQFSTSKVKQNIHNAFQLSPAKPVIEVSRCNWAVGPGSFTPIVD